VEAVSEHTLMGFFVLESLGLLFEFGRKHRREIGWLGIIYILLEIVLFTDVVVRHDQWVNCLWEQVDR